MQRRHQSNTFASVSRATAFHRGSDQIPAQPTSTEGLEKGGEEGEGVATLRGSDRCCLATGTTASTDLPVDRCNDRLADEGRGSRRFGFLAVGMERGAATVGRGSSVNARGYC